MDLRILRYFQVVAECGSYSRGSEMLRISQPAVSRAIRLLEEGLGQRLFVRHGHGVSLTEAGEKLLAHSRVILHHVADALDDIERTGQRETGRLRIALPPAVGAMLAPILVERMAATRPGVSLEFVGGYSAYIQEWIIRDQVDMACLHDPEPHKDLVQHPLMREEVFLVGHKDLMPVQVVARIEDLAALPLVLPSGSHASRRVLTAWGAKGNIWVKPVLIVDDHTILRAMVRAGVGGTLLTQAAFLEDQRAGLVQSIPLSPEVYWTLCLVRSRRTPSTDLLRHFMQILTGIIEERIASGLWLAPA